MGAVGLVSIQHQAAILLFGPSHGTCMNIVAGCPVVYTADSEPPDFRPMDNMTPQEMIAATKIHRHTYRYQDVMSSMNGEDVAIYVHDENCCEKVIPDGANTSMRAMR